MIFFIGCAALVATLLGGVFAIRFHDRLHLVLGFSAGAVIGVAFFDLLPESIGLLGGTYSVSGVTTLVAVGFVLYMLADRLLIGHCHEDECVEHDVHSHFGAGSLSVHSFLDGIAIGLSFQVSVAVGAIVTAAVLAHDFSDGINTVGMVLRHGGTKGRAARWLIVDALAPLFGISVTFLFVPSQKILGILLALFTGFFLYIGASDLLPESHHRHPVIWTTIATVLGMAVLYAVVVLAGI